MAKFDSVRAKLGRAAKHIQDAQELSTAFLNTDFYRVGSKQDSQRRLLLTIERIDPFPIEFGILIGDAAHNLRSALDHIAFIFSKPRTIKEQKRVQFPLTSTSAKFKSEVAAGRLPGMPHEIRTTIERFQPYHRRKEPEAKFLGQVQAINNWDKHRAISLTATGLARSKFNVVVKGGALLAHETFVGRKIKKGTIVARFTLAIPSGYTDVNVQSELVVGPVFGNRMAIGNVPVFVPLKRSLKFIEETVTPTFERFL